MNPEGRWPRPRAVVWIAALATVAVVVGYQFPRTERIELGASLLGALTAEQFHDAEGTYRWSRARSAVIFPDPGVGRNVRVEADVSAFRPRGERFPLFVMEAAGKSVRERLERGAHTLSLELAPRIQGRLWSSDLEIAFRSETFVPGGADQRALGVRVHEVRLIPLGGMAFPPLRQVLSIAWILWALVALLMRWEIPAHRARAAGGVAALLGGLGFAIARPYAALASGPLALGLMLLVGVELLYPSLVAFVGRALRGSLYAAREGAKALGSGPSLALGLAGCIGISLAYLARPVITIDLGSGHETTLLDRFASFDRDAEATFRKPLRGASIDLRDFGGASTWKIELTASLPEGRRELGLVEVDDRRLDALVGRDWTTFSLEATVPVRWRSGLRLRFPEASEAIDLRIDRLRIDRGTSLPSARILLLTVGAAWCLVVAVAGTGVAGIWKFSGAGLILALAATALYAAPVLVIPFAGTFFVAAVAALAVGLLFRGVVSALAEQGLTPLPAPGAMAASAMGFLAWLTTTLFPLYDGGHFVFHSSIAEEIWQGAFLTYYLPYPGSMLSRQPQWGNLIVPHSCLYHTIMSPLAALPRPWFYGLEKAGLALMLAMMVLVTALVAAHLARSRPLRASALAAVIAAGLPPAYQLLGLGHLMTLFGCWAGSLALGLIILRFDHLTERATWWWTVGVLTLCFLSYTAALLFTGVALVGGLLWLSRRAPVPSRRLWRALLSAAALAFVLYYVHWTWPFLSESLPAIITGQSSAAGDGVDLGQRLGAVPRKLAYTYGTALLPVIGLAGLGLARSSPARALLTSWAGILVVFSGLDLFFNFLLKHHYFTMPPVAVGAGLLASWLHERKPWGRALAWIFVSGIVLMGLSRAWNVALGG